MSSLKELRKKYLADLEESARALRRCSEAAREYAQSVRPTDDKLPSIIQITASTGPVRKTRSRKKAERVEGMPLPSTAYQLFKKAVKANLTKSGEPVTGKDFTNECKRSWEQLDASGKEPYENTARNYKLKYETALQKQKEKAAGTEVSDVEMSEPEVDLEELDDKAKETIFQASQQIRIKAQQSPKKADGAAEEEDDDDDDDDDEEETESESDSNDSYDIGALKPDNAAKTTEAAEDSEESDDDDELSE